MAASRVHEIADGYVTAYAALDPTTATAVGIDDHGSHLPDHSPEGVEARDELARSTRRALAAAVQKPAAHAPQVAALT